MRLNKLFIASLLALSTLMLQSCLKNQEDIFEESSSERLQAALDNAKAVLTSSPGGWLFDYYPDKDLSYGGVIYTVKFDNEKVSVRSEIAPDYEESSLYKLTDDNGPMLSFDSYNTLMHYYATPFVGNEDSGYQAQDGDFEFMIMNVTEDLITLRGKRTGNTMYLRRMTDDAATYINAVAKVVKRQVISEYTGTIGSEEVSCGVSIKDRHMEFAINGATVAEEYYLPTPTGIRFRNPIEINGATISELAFSYNEADNTSTYTGTDSNGNQILLSGQLAATYAFKDAFEGEFTIIYDGGESQIDVTLEPDPSSTAILIKGLSSAFNLVATYNNSYGCLQLCGQQIGSLASGDVLFLAGTNTGFWPSSAVGYYFIKNPASPSLYQITPNSSQAAECNNSFVIVISASDGYYLPIDPWLIKGNYMLSDIVGFVKK